MNKLSVSQVAALTPNRFGKLGVSDAYIRRLCAEGHLPAERLGLRSYMIDQDVFEAWLKERHNAR